MTKTAEAKKATDNKKAAATSKANAKKATTTNKGNELNELLRGLPQVDEVMKHQNIETLKHALAHDFLRTAVRDVLDGIRQTIISGVDEDYKIPTTEEIAHNSCVHALQLIKPSLRHVINASGVIIHTNLGRSTLCKEAIDAVNDVTKGYSTLEYSTKTMSRGSRHDHIEQLICTLTGAEAAIAVNNNAAAVMMVLNEFAKGHEAIVSRGELVEIGGSFRVPDIMAMSNATMVEVGTTNKTHVEDYERNINDNTAMLLKVHPSNYRMEGFVEDVSIKDLQKVATAENARRKKEGIKNKVIVYEDQGSGVLIEDEFFKKNGEHTITEALKLGVDIVSFSGDKLLGGPQAGIIVGRKEFIDRLKKNPLARALRLDKMTLAALEATLRTYLNEEEAREKIPTLRMLTEDAAVTKKRADKLKKTFEKEVSSDDVSFKVISEISRAGGGSLPMCDIPTYCVCATFNKGTAEEADRYLIQECEPPIIARLTKDCIYFDARTLDEDELPLLVKGVHSYILQVK